MNIFEVLNNLNIEYQLLEHKPVYTVEEAKQLENMIEGIGCKNLFLKDKQHNYYLLVIEEDKKADLKHLASFLNTSKLSFASSDALKEILNLEPGSVTPLSIINDKNNKCKIILDKDIENKKILVHPNTNTKTLSIEFNDLIRVIDYTNHNYIIYKG